MKEEDASTAQAAVALVTPEPVAATPTTPPSLKSGDLSPAEKAAKFRAEAERARLEAQRMDAELTLRKIEMLERKVQRKQMHPPSKNGDNATVSSDDEENAKLQEEINRLSQKFKEKTTNITNGVAYMNGLSSSLTLGSKITDGPKVTEGVVWPRFVGNITQEKKLFILKDFAVLTNMPKFVKVFMTEMMTPWLILNTTAIDETDMIVQIIEQAVNGDFKSFNVSAPAFTQAELDKAIEAVKEFRTVPYVSFEKLKALSDDNEEGIEGLVSMLVFKGIDATLLVLWADVASQNPNASIEDLARLRLEYLYYGNELFRLISNGNVTDETEQRLIKAASKEWYLKPFFRTGVDGNTTLLSDLDAIIDSMFPKSTTQLNIENPVLPPQAQVDRLASEVLPQTMFRATSKPMPVLGGFVIKGSSIPRNDERFGEKVVQSIDNMLVQRKYADLAKSMTICYLPDFLNVDDDGDDLFGPDENPPVLYICGPTISRRPRPIQLSFVSGLGFSMTWCLSLAPFLLNRGIASRVEEELAMIDAGVMTPNLSWLTDLSFPLFVVFCSIQILHEVAHGVVAKANGIKTFPPTLVPSILTGITSSVTSLKTPPPNWNAMFDYAIVGPLTGMAVSSLAIVWGSQLSVMMDGTNFPALPLEILRRSTLGGGIINIIFGNGVLDVPAAVLGTPIVAEMTVALHPLAVAGYISLIVNALSLLPIGTTDGGRVALSIFGRPTKRAIGSFMLAVLLWFGVSGSDLFLYYFSFCIAFQSGNEIPARNEVDNLSISRVFLAIFAYVVVALTLIPFK